MYSVRRTPWSAVKLRVREFAEYSAGTARWLIPSSIRRLIPTSVKYRLAGLVRVAESIVPSTHSLFESRPIALTGWRPLFCADEFASGTVMLVNNALAAGGVERQVVNTLRGLQERGISAGLVCLRLHESAEFDFFLPALVGFPGIVRNILPARQAKAILRSIVSREALASMLAAIRWMPFDVQMDVLRFAAEFATLKPSVVHAWQDSANIAAGYGARLVGVPHILVSSRNLIPTNFAYFRPYMLPAYRELASCESIIMINNSEAGAYDYSRWIGVPRERFVVKRNGIEADIMGRPAKDAIAALKAKLGIPDNATVVGSIFRFYAEKQPLLWVETAARVSVLHSNCHFVVFGEGPLQAEALVAATKCGLAGRVHFPGNIENSELGLSLFDVFLLTSKFEGTPNVVLEASLLGIPVVATDTGGTREAIEDGKTGYVARADSNELARHVLNVLDDASWRSKVTIAGPAFVKERFGLARMLDETLTLYRSTSA